MTQYIQIDGGKAIALFSCMQDPEHVPGVIEVEDDDPRYIAFVTPVEAAPITDPVEKLKAFLADNPDVAAILK